MRTIDAAAHTVSSPTSARKPDRAWILGVASLAILLLVPLRFSEVIVYKAGLVVIFAIAALGLHILVNWSGELSLAHAGVVGVPAFVTLGVSETHGISPIYLLPVAMGVGAVTGVAVAIPALRARDTQVALVTLAAGLAIDRFFFTRSWLVGHATSGRAATRPTLAWLRFDSSRDLYPVVAAIAALALGAAWMLLHSKVARAWFWIRSDPAAAAAFGIPVVAYRLLAHAVAGVFAGLAGGLAVVWIQRLNASAFPPTLSMTYLIVAVFAGPGYIGGLAMAVVVLEGGRLFFAGFGPFLTYLGACALIFNITQYPGGLNAAGRRGLEQLRGRGQRHDLKATEVLDG